MVQGDFKLFIFGIEHHGLSIKVVGEKKSKTRALSILIKQKR